MWYAYQEMPASVVRPPTPTSGVHPQACVVRPAECRDRMLLGIAASAKYFHIYALVHMCLKAV